ncbi:MAG TPA: HAD family hydrolase [Phycisphaerales bacterium]|nr:HAD family hydrolase [Phycisphaerales bacterium]
MGTEARNWLVVFDLGGVVVRICRSWREASQAAGFGPEAPGLAPELAERRRALHRDYERGGLSCEEYFRAIAEATGGRYTADEARRVHEAWLLEEYPGVGALIDDLHGRGIETGVLSNTNAAHWAVMEQARFAACRRPKHRHASFLLGAGKPEAEAYRRFAQRARGAGWRGEAGDIIYFDDLPENVEAARREGWRGVLVDPWGDPAAQMRAALQEAGPLAPARTPALPRGASATPPPRR